MNFTSRQDETRDEESQGQIGKSALTWWVQQADRAPEDSGRPGTPGGAQVQPHLQLQGSVPCAFSLTR